MKQKIYTTYYTYGSSLWKHTRIRRNKAHRDTMKSMERPFNKKMQKSLGKEDSRDRERWGRVVGETKYQPEYL